MHAGKKEIKQIGKYKSILKNYVVIFIKNLLTINVQSIVIHFHNLIYHI